jgi:hypothetical protein
MGDSEMLAWGKRDRRDSTFVFSIIGELLKGRGKVCPRRRGDAWLVPAPGVDVVMLKYFYLTCNGVLQ